MGTTEKYLMTTNTAALIALLVRELKTDIKEDIDIQKASIAILAIAGTQYGVSTYLYDRYPEVAEEIRYIDWLLTTPLLLFTYWKLAKGTGYNSKFQNLAIAVVTMVVLGYFAEEGTNSLTWFIASMIPYVYILLEIQKIQKNFEKRGMKEHVKLGNFFIYGWAVYPLAFYAPDSYKYILYSIGDFINKGLYSLTLYNVLQK